MSVSEAAQRPSGRGASLKIWIALLLLVTAAVALAWYGAGSLRGETTATGLRFRTIEQGSGPLIQPVDGVLIEYEGRLPDGTVFDSSEGRGPTPMIAGQVIPGFAEALTKMRKGGKYRVQIPAKLAYGAEPPTGSPIPPNADLEFDVEVVEVVPNAALMTQGPPGVPQGAPGQPQAVPQGQPQPAPPEGERQDQPQQP